MSVHFRTLPAGGAYAVRRNLDLMESVNCQDYADSLKSP